MLKGFWFFKLSHSALLAYFIGKTELKILSFVCTFFHFFRQGKILKLSVDGLTLKTETLASPSSRYDLKIISYDIFLSIIFPLIGSEGQSIILEALLQGQAMLQVRIISNAVCLIIITSLLIIPGLKLIPAL